MNWFQGFRTLTRKKPAPPDFSWHYEIRIVEQPTGRVWSVVEQVHDDGRRFEMARFARDTPDDARDAAQLALMDLRLPERRCYE